MIEWHDIATAKEGRTPVLLIALYPSGAAWSDIYYGWREGKWWQRWPHQFPPTHWAEANAPDAKS